MRTVLYSKAVAAAAGEFEASYWRRTNAPSIALESAQDVEEFFTGIAKAARAAGADLDAWIEGQMLIGIGGSVADAVARRLPFASLQASPEDQVATLPCSGRSGRRSQREQEIRSIGGDVAGAVRGPGDMERAPTLAAACPAEGGIISGCRAWEIFSAAMTRPSVEMIPLSAADQRALNMAPWQMRRRFLSSPAARAALVAAAPG